MIERNLIALSYTVVFESAFHCGSGLSNGLIDRSVVRNRQQYLYIPGSTIKGVVRESCEQIALLYGLQVRDPHNEYLGVRALQEKPDIVERLFGSRCYESSLFFDNAVLDGSSRQLITDASDPERYLHLQCNPRTQTRISRRTRVVQEKALFTSEFGLPLLRFTGAIHGVADGIPNDLSELPGPFPLFLLVPGVYAVTRIGAGRTTGMGCCRFEITTMTVGGQPVNAADYCDEEALETLDCYQDAREEN